MDPCPDRTLWQNVELVLSPQNWPIGAFFAIPLVIFALLLAMGLWNGRLLGFSKRFRRTADPFHYWSGQIGCATALAAWGLLTVAYLSLPSCL
ncbi:MAG TPA: hypothetical protein VGF56_13060 [Rhizomicrobium sp.]|jgi:hypothetical protein